MKIGGGAKILVQVFRGRGQNFSASLQRGGDKISVHRHLRALLKHLENALKNYDRNYMYNDPGILCSQYTGQFEIIQTHLEYE